MRRSRMVMVNQASTMSLGTPARNSNVNSVGILEDGNAQEIFLEVSVINPITRKKSSGELVTTYAIYIETNDSAFTMSKSMVRRRYSEFVILRSILQEQHPSLTVPRLPGRTLLGKRFDQHFIQDRCSGLQSFLKAIVEQPVYLSNKSLHLFLQTSLTMDQVKNVVNGCDSFELPHNNSMPFVLYPLDVKALKQGDRVGILKRESCASLVRCPEHECQAQGKHEHMRVGSGIVVCPYAVSGSGSSAVLSMAGSAPFNIPAGSPRRSPVNAIRSCASDTCIDGAAPGPSSLTGSRKRVSFLIEKDNKQSLLRRCEVIHKDSNGTATQSQGKRGQASTSGETSSNGAPERSERLATVKRAGQDEPLTEKPDDESPAGASEHSDNNKGDVVDHNAQPTSSSQGDAVENKDCDIGVTKDTEVTPESAAEATVQAGQ